MQLLATLGIEVANVLRYLLPAFCYVAAGVLGINGCVMVHEGGRDPRRGLAHYGTAFLSFLVAALLISIDRVANLTSASIGGDGRVGIGGGLLAYSDPNLASSGSAAGAFLAVVETFLPALYALGMLSLVCAMMELRQIGRSSDKPVRRAAVRAAAAAILLNARTIATSLLSGA